MGATKTNATQHHLCFAIKAPSPLSARHPRVSNPLMTTTTISQLSVPLELVLSILDYACLPSPSQLDNATLRSCSLVCRAWSHAAQKLLFRNVRIANAQTHSAVQDSLKSSPHLASAVTSLQATIDWNQSAMLQPLDFARMVKACPNVTHIELSIYGSPGPEAAKWSPCFDEEALQLLSATTGVLSLRLCDWSCEMPVLESLLAAWPSIRSLSLSGYEAAYVPGSTSVPCAIRDLRVNSRTSPSVEFLEWLLQSSDQSLRSVDFERTPCSETLSYVTETYATTLTALAVPSCGLRDHVQAIQHCKALQDFRVETPWTSPFLVWKVLPPTIQNISFGLNKDTTLQCIVDVVRQSQSLRSVSVHLWDGASSNPQLSALQVACAVHGIELHFTKDISMFRTETRRI